MSVPFVLICEMQYCPYSPIQSIIIIMYYYCALDPPVPFKGLKQFKRAAAAAIFHPLRLHSTAAASAVGSWLGLGSELGGVNARSPLSPLALERIPEYRILILNRGGFSKHFRVTTLTDSDIFCRAPTQH